MVEKQKYTEKKGKIGTVNFENLFEIFHDRRLSKIKYYMTKYIFGYLWKRTTIEGKKIEDFIKDWYDYFEVPEDDRI